MRAALLICCLSLAAPAFAQDAPVNSGKAVDLPHSDSPAAQSLTDAERCSVDSLAQRATIVALRSELAKAQAKIAELEAPLVDQAVQRERAALEQRFRDRIKPPEGSTFDWSTLTFVPTPATQVPPQ